MRSNNQEWLNHTDRVKLSLIPSSFSKLGWVIPPWATQEPHSQEVTMAIPAANPTAQQNSGLFLLPHSQTAARTGTLYHAQLVLLSQKATMVP